MHMIVETQILGRPTAENQSLTTESALVHLKNEFSSYEPPQGYVRGRTEMRNVLAEKSGCSLAKAEAVVERLIADGQVRYRGDSFAPEELPASWEILS